MATAPSFFLVLFALVLLVHSASAYSLVSNYSGSSFFDNFNFWGNNPDPTNGYVYYTTRQQATDWGLINTKNGKVYIGTDSWGVASGSGRVAVRLTSKAKFNQGLFAVDLDHMPTGCGTWPAFWMVGPKWPSAGEIDIIEGVNQQSYDKVTLHTSDGCTQWAQSPLEFSGTFNSYNCYVKAPNQHDNEGCGITSNTQNYGAALNNMGGGTFVTEWQNDHIQTWFFPRGKAPQDLVSGNPKTSTWKLPFAKFRLGDNCSPTHFHDLQIVINLTFCGDWAGNTFAQDCPGLGDCNSYVQNNPAAFQQAYWSINSITIFH